MFEYIFYSFIHYLLFIVFWSVFLRIGLFECYTSIAAIKGTNLIAFIDTLPNRIELKYYYIFHAGANLEESGVAFLGGFVKIIFALPFIGLGIYLMALWLISSETIEDTAILIIFDILTFITLFRILVFWNTLRKRVKTYKAEH